MINSVLLNNGDVKPFSVKGVDGYALEINNGEGSKLITDIVLLKDEKAYSVKLFNKNLNEKELTSLVSTFVIE